MIFLENRCENKKIYNQLTKAIIAKKMCVFVYHEMFKLSLNLMQKTALPI